MKKLDRVYITAINWEHRTVILQLTPGQMEKVNSIDLSDPYISVDLSNLSHKEPTP